MKALKEIIEDLRQEAMRIQIQSRSLTNDEMARVEAIYQVLPHLNQALTILSTEIASTSRLITYKIVSDIDGKLKRGARTACNFWNRFIIPSSSIVVRIGVFTPEEGKNEEKIIARAYRPYEMAGIIYGRVEFNTEYLSTYSRNEISGTIIHEIGHTLGFGWKWMNLFDADNGVFTRAAVNTLPDLKDMRVETDYGPGTQYSHWDERRHDEELMTGIKDNAEHVLPVTVKIMALLGHRIREDLPRKTDLDTLLDRLERVVFSRQAEAKAINLDHFEQTDLWENIPHDQPLSK